MHFFKKVFPYLSFLLHPWWLVLTSGRIILIPEKNLFFFFAFANAIHFSPFISYILPPVVTTITKWIFILPIQFAFPPLRHSLIILILSSKIFVGKLCVYCVEFWSWESFHVGGHLGWVERQCTFLCHYTERFSWLRMSQIQSSISAP